MATIWNVLLLNYLDYMKTTSTKPEVSVFHYNDMIIFVYGKISRISSYTKNGIDKLAASFEHNDGWNKDIAKISAQLFYNHLHVSSKKKAEQII